MSSLKKWDVITTVASCHWVMNTDLIQHLSRTTVLIIPPFRTIGVPVFWAATRQRYHVPGMNFLTQVFCLHIPYLFPAGLLIRSLPDLLLIYVVFWVACLNLV